VSSANSLVGSTLYDSVGENFVDALANGNYVVASPSWSSEFFLNVGAVTWANGSTGITGAVSPANSLVGTATADQVGSASTYLFENGDYLVSSPYWDNGAAVDAGAVTWVNGLTGLTGPVSATNSLVGSKTNDRVGDTSSMELANGNYVVPSPYWDNGGILDAGAATWADGDTGITGTISAANSLVGSSTSDMVGNRIGYLTNGNYVVSSPLWDYGSTQDAGAATFGNGLSGTVGFISPANSLVGGSDFDEISSYGVLGLTNGNYIVVSPEWDNGGIVNAGAATWGSGATGITGLVSAANSLVGASVDDHVGEGGAEALTNGNYVVASPLAQINGIIQAGAVTWGNGASGRTGTISTANSLFGPTAGDNIGSDGIWTLNQGNYVVLSPYWHGIGIVDDAGAATFGNGQTGVVGPVSAANSLVGSHLEDHVGMEITALSNGNYVVQSWDWNNGANLNAGAATWGSGVSGVKGELTAANSLVGSKTGDQVGYYGAILLKNGNYVVLTPEWDNGLITDAGAATWGNGAAGTVGPISAANSLVGSSNSDMIGYAGGYSFGSNDYFVFSPSWSNGASLDVGAITFVPGSFPSAGTISAQNSVIGAQPGSGHTMNKHIDSFHRQLVVGMPMQNQVVLYRPYYDLYLATIRK
jgi:hypothetical protein